MRAAERAAAKAEGKKTYFTGKPCIRGHIAERRVDGKVCVQCRAEDREKNREANREYQNKRYCENIEVERAKRTLSRKIFLEKNPEYHRDYSREHYKQKKQIYRAAGRKRRAIIRSIKGSHHTASDIERIGKAQKYKCAICRKNIRNDFHADHIVPLAKGGSNSSSNIQLLCPTCNRKKSHRDPVEFMQSQGFLI